MAKKKLSEIMKIENFLKAQVLIPAIGAIAAGAAWWAVSTFVLPHFEPKAPVQKPTIIIERTIIIEKAHPLSSKAKQQLLKK